MWNDRKLYVFFWVIPRRLNFICRRFGTPCLFYLHRQVGAEWLGLRNVGILIREKVWIENFRAKSFPVSIPQHFSNLVILHLPAYEEGTVCSETSAYKIQTPGNYPEESIQHSEHGESLKWRIEKFITTILHTQTQVNKHTHSAIFI
jgi:hypothetical protein